MSDLSDLYQEVILDHNKRPQELPRARERQPSRRGLQPAVRRPAAPLPDRWTTTS